MLYSEKCIFLYKLSLVIIQICQLTAEDKLLDGLDAKISITTKTNHLKSENTVITRELVRKLKTVL